MPSPLSDAHIEAQARLRALIVRVVNRLWGDLPGYDRGNIDEWLAGVLPVVEAAQRTSVALTEAFIARHLGRQPLGVAPELLVGAAVRRGTKPAEVYQRPFVTLWTALGDGTAHEDAVAKALARAESTAAMDVQLSMRATADAVERADPAIYGYTRAADAGACKFCNTVNGAYVKRASAMALHNHCGCGLEPLTEPHSGAALLPSGVAVHEHGELGPILADPSHSFTTAAQALA